MATWRGKPKKFKMEIFIKPDYHHSVYEDVEYSWEYQTTADVLTIKEVSPNNKSERCYGPDDARALLYTLMSWCNCYDSPEDLDKMIADIRKCEDEK